MKNKAAIIGILLILIGFCITYFFGYKENIFFGIISYFALFLGWIIIVMTLFGKLYSFNKPKFKLNKKIWFFKSLKNVGIVIFAVIGIFTSIVITGNITDKRIQNILHTETNYKTIAEIINLEKRHTRGGWKIWAIFQYKTLENKTYTKGIFNYGNIFKKGDKYNIIYVKKYPEIIKIEDKVE